MYESLYYLINKYDADIAECYCQRVYDNDIPENIEYVDKVYVTKGFDIIPMVYQACIPGTTPVYNKLFKRKCFNNVEFEEGRIYEDTLISPLLYYNADLIVSTSNKYYYYFLNENSTTNSAWSLKNLDMLWVCQQLRNFFEEKNMIKAGYLLDATYSFTMIKHMKNLKKYKQYDLDGHIYNQIYREFRKLLPEFLKNPEILWKQKILLVYNILLLRKN